MKKIFSFLLLGMLSIGNLWAVNEVIAKLTITGQTTCTVTGTIGGTGAVNQLGSKSPYKLNTDGAYVALTLADGNYYQAGDIIKIDGSKKMAIYTGAPTTGEMLAETDAPSNGVISYTLPANLPANTSCIYLYRSSSTYNGTLTYMSVTRDVEGGQEIPVTGISLNKTTTTIVNGATESLVATIIPDNATNTNVSWTSSNESVATVSNGTITTVSVGNATITATTEDGGFSSDCVVTVIAPATVNDLVSISTNYTFIADNITANGTESLAANRLYDEGRIFTPTGNDVSTAKGNSTIGGESHLNSLRLKGNQDQLAFKVSGPCTITFYSESRSDRGIQVGSTAVGTEYGTQTASTTEWECSIPNAGIIYLSSYGNDFYFAGFTVEFTTPAQTYTVTYKANGGTGDDIVDDNATLIAGNTFTAPSGKQFAHWNTAADGSGFSYDMGGIVQNDLILFAIWEDIPTPDPCTTHFYFFSEADQTSNGKTNSNIFSEMPSGSSNMNGSITIDATTYNTTRRSGDVGTNVEKNLFTISAGKKGTFYALAVSSGSSARQIILKRVSDGITLSADVPGGSSSLTAIEIDNVPYGTYSIQQGGGNARLGMVAVDICDAEYYTVTFNSNEGSSVDSQEIMDGETAVKPSDPTRDGFAFGGWQLNGEDYNFSTPVTADITLDAIWIAAVTVTYYDGANELGTEAVVAGESPVEYETYQTKAHYSFEGWYNNADLADAHKIADISELVINANVSVYGKWTITYSSTVDLGAEAAIKTKTAIGTLMENNGIVSTISTSNGGGYDTNGIYTGFKTKTKGEYFELLLQQGKTAEITFGYVKSGVIITIDGTPVDFATSTNDLTVFRHTATAADALIKVTNNSENSQTTTIKSIAVVEDYALTTADNDFYGLYLPYEVTIPAGITAYTGTLNQAETELSLTQVSGTVIPAATPVLVKSNAAGTFTFEPNNTGAASIANSLKGVARTTAVSDIPASGKTCLTLGADGEGVVAFRKPAGSSIAANKVYLTVTTPNAQQAPSIRIIEAGNGATDIKSIEDSEKAVKFIENGKLYIQKNGIVYDVTGVMVK